MWQSSALLRQHPLNQDLHIIGCGLDLGMSLAAADLGHQRRFGIGLALVLGGDVFECRADFLAVYCVAVQTAAALGEFFLRARRTCCAQCDRRNYRHPDQFHATSFSLDGNWMITCTAGSCRKFLRAGVYPSGHMTLRKSS